MGTLGQPEQLGQKGSEMEMGYLHLSTKYLRWFYSVFFLKPLSERIGIIIRQKLSSRNFLSSKSWGLMFGLLFALSVVLSLFWKHAYWSTLKLLLNLGLTLDCMLC